MAVVGKREQDAVLRHIEKVLPANCKIELLGSSAAIEHNIPGLPTLTKDVDLSLVVMDKDGTRLAAMDVVEEVLERLAVEPDQKPEDESWVKVYVPLDEAKYQVDFIRGKNRDRPRGTFIERSILEDIIARSQPRGRILLPSLTDLIVMKAWASVDQARHAEDRPAEGDRFKRRAEAYARDARTYAEAAITRRELDPRRMDELLGKMAHHRKGPVEDVLLRAGALAR
ncbi:MAG: hypothetical protein LC624_11090 [Halobacteriales archaeon]|nr:hypothetical protein [Halobacteriales archaeon]